MNIGSEQLAPLLKEITPEQEIYIVDREGRIVFTQDQLLINQQLKSQHPQLPMPFLGSTYSSILSFEKMDHVVTAVPSSRGNGPSFPSFRLSIMNPDKASFGPLSFS
ncbi:hypothetical protein N6H14_27165 [Paenibacillus sp. CC-CFT747]|nr:hypothetical protein N6H14_27165 [Paenibacillus sp. CC-CFT747]